ncbi:MAG: MFS transporter [Thermomicrobiales bacterium]
MADRTRANRSHEASLTANGHEPSPPDPDADDAADRDLPPPPKVPGGPRAFLNRSGRPPRTAPRVEGGRRWMPSLRGFQSIRLPDALQNPNFRRYWSSQLFSLAGTWMQNTGSSLVVLSLTTSAVAIGTINVVSSLPMLLFSLFGGVVADRVPRRRILMTTQSLLGVISLIYAFLIFTDQIQFWHILVLAACGGTIASFELPASQAFVSELVRRDDLPQALALNSASFNATRTIGPAMAGVVIGALGTAAAFVINAFTLLAPISVLYSLKGRVRETPTVRRGSGLSQLKEGIAYIRRTEEVLGLILITTIFSFFVFPNLLVLMPLYVDDVLGGGESWVAAMISVLGIGSLIGAIVLVRGSRLEVAAGRRLRTSMIGLTVGLLWLSLSPNPWVAVPGVLISGYAFATGNTQISTRVQQLAPDDLRGRVLSVNSLAFNGVMPFATMIVSFLAESVGQHIVMGACSVLLAIGSVLIWKRYAWKAFVPASRTVATVS